MDRAVVTRSSQDSPFTLGASTFKNLNNNFNYSGSLYISKLDAGQSDADETISIPLEYGINSYLGYQPKPWPIEVYGGFDHERFSSYNTEELVMGMPLATREHVLTFLTVGLTRRFEWLGKKFLTKASFSQSVISSQSSASLADPAVFEGNKFILYLNMKAYKNWSYHSFYKQHNLEGPTQLVISRFGLGFGYSF